MTLRRRLLLLTCALLATAVVATQSIGQNRPRITLAQMEEMFKNMRVKTKWNVDGDLLWGYFFMDPRPEKLRPLSEELAAAGYRVVNLYPSPNGRTHVLHIEKVETHTPQSLHQRNSEFYRLADKFGISSYDGMDVGPAEPQPR